MTAPLVVTVIGSAVPATAAAALIVLPATTLFIPAAIAPIVPLPVAPIVVPAIVTRIVPGHLVTLMGSGHLVARCVPGNRVPPDISGKSVSVFLEPIVVATAFEQPELDQIGADSVEVVAVVIRIEVDDDQPAAPFELPPPIVPTVVTGPNPFDPTKPSATISTSVADDDPPGDGTASDTDVSPDPLGFNLLDRQERQQQCGSEYQVPGFHSVLRCVFGSPSAPPQSEHRANS
jgi:hypothetical protein